MSHIRFLLVGVALLGWLSSCRDYAPLPNKSTFTYPFVPDSLYRDTIWVLVDRIAFIPVSSLGIFYRYEASASDSIRNLNHVNIGGDAGPPHAPKALIAPSHRGSYSIGIPDHPDRYPHDGLYYHLPAGYRPDSIQYRGRIGTVPFDTIPYTIYWQETGGPPRQARGETIVKAYPPL